MKWCAKVNNENVFKTNMITIALDSSEDHLVSKKLMDLVGTEMLEFRKKFLEKKTSIHLLRALTPNDKTRKCLKERFK